MLREPGAPVRRGRAGVRRDVRERPGRAAHRLPVPRGQPARRDRAGHRRPVGAGAGLVHLRRRRPDGALQRQRGCAEDADPAPHPLGGVVRAVRRRGRRGAAPTCSTPRSPPSSCPVGEDEEVQSSEATVGPYALQDFTLFHVLRYGFRPSKIAFLAWHAWRDVALGDWPPGSRRTSARRTRSRRSGTGWRCSPSGSSSSASSSGRRCPTARRCRRAARCPPAATGARPRTCPPGSGSTRSRRSP